ncbi:MAG TPA: DUF302 domain-containing protein [candidate division Zixibacteria bacterium]|nr:DUF302 domain-containing protein [candidate division Zixibacteria bacterium]
MSIDTATLGRTVFLETDMDTALEKVAGALKDEGFGILTEIDVKKTLKAKIDVDFRPYRILGACNPPLAYRALSAASQVGLLLPCNVTVSEIGLNQVEVSIIDPLAMLSLVDDPELQAVAKEAKERLERVASALEEN